MDTGRPFWRGFTLLESLIALGFLAIASLAVLATFLFSSRLDTKKQERHQAAFLALEVMEETRALVQSDYSLELALPKTPHPEVEGYSFSREEVFVGESIGAEAELLKEVRVKVYWQDSSGEKYFLLQERFARP